jgi:hypothetical protein
MCTVTGEPWCSVARLHVLLCVETFRGSDDEVQLTKERPWRSSKLAPLASPQGLGRWIPRSDGAENPLLLSFLDGRFSIRKVEIHQDGRHMVAHDSVGDEQLVRDLRICKAPGEEIEYLGLSGSEACRTSPYIPAMLESAFTSPQWSPASLARR